MSSQFSQQHKNKTRAGGAKKLTKQDIGTPTDFKHVTHVGWNATSGFDLTGEDEALKPFLEKAGVSESQLKDRHTRAFIYDFIQNHNVSEAVKTEKAQKPAPPVPSRHSNSNGGERIRPAPPLPPLQDSKKEPEVKRERNPAPLPPLPVSAPPRGPPRPPPININTSSGPPAAAVRIYFIYI